MRHAALLAGDKETGEAILIVSKDEFRAMTDAISAAIASHSRKTSWKSLLKKLEDVEMW